MDYSFTEIFDIPSLTNLLESYTETNGVVTALLDLNGHVHIKTGWQDICTQFHRVHPTSSQRCTESDTILAEQLESGSSYNVYCCKNGLVDVAVPVIVDGEHIANFFTGQFFFEPPNKKQFVHQGKALGYELIPYVNALEKVPVFSEEEIKRIMKFLVNLAQIIGEMGKARLDLLKAKESEKDRVIQLEAARSQLERLVAEDPLTGLYNRRKFHERLYQEYSRAMRYEKDLSLAMIDTDNFKQINDTYGHTAGDQILKKIAETIEGTVRNCDIVARIGGDEFCVVFPETNPKAAMNALKNILRNIDSIRVVQDSISISVSCSIGYSSIDSHCSDAEDLLIKADKALYQAKSQGRNRVVEFLSTDSCKLAT